MRLGQDSRRSPSRCRSRAADNEPAPRTRPMGVLPDGRPPPPHDAGSVTRHPVAGPTTPRSTDRYTPSRRPCRINSDCASRCARRALRCHRSTDSPSLPPAPTFPPITSVGARRALSGPVAEIPCRDQPAIRCVSRLRSSGGSWWACMTRGISVESRRIASETIRLVIPWSGRLTTSIGSPAPRSPSSMMRR